MAKCLLKDFNGQWLDEDVADFLAGDNGEPRRGHRNRQVGIHPLLCVATFLDPNMKNLRSVCDLESKGKDSQKSLLLFSLSLIDSIESIFSN